VPCAFATLADGANNTIAKIDTTTVAAYITLTERLPAHPPFHATILAQKAVVSSWFVESKIADPAIAIYIRDVRQWPSAAARVARRQPHSHPGGPDKRYRRLLSDDEVALPAT
jgi:hypothetical protein